jgi:hypothetical protein
LDVRIRSIKPEFWTSEDIAALDWETRLLFIGLWSYVDDNGVGRDVERLIVADLFPLEDDPRDTLARVSRGLQTLHARSLIARYTVAGRQFLHISTWDKHQRIDRPGKPRYPLPTCEDAVSRDMLATPSRDVRETPSPGAVEQWSRGTGEQGKATATQSGASAPAPRAVALVESVPEITAQTLIAEWLDACPKRPPGDVIGQIGKHLAALLGEGIDPADVRNGLAEWHRKGLHPRTLSSVVNEVMNSRPQRRNGQDIDWAAAMDRAKAREESA